ncbi:hypothetical protein D9615_007512 [Tricholomella constricta]|uniref:Uncharacterized protein n=1 Tax=Tricholomella constricta TaxID=117010 RepID=A0A8H5M2F2_9AGAR|nr:hypothetical protein D9615_007512 [Tricholomella constricta]
MTRHPDTSSEKPGSGVDTAAGLAQKAGEAAISTYHALNDSEPHYIPGSPYSSIRHTRPWIYYQGISTLVPISILGRVPLPESRRFSLQQRGWRTGLLGWTVGSWLGGTIGKETDVTPETYESWEEGVEAQRREQYDQEIKQFLESPLAAKDHKVLESDMIHIPVASGDGYFRILVYPSAASYSPIASTASFRVGSLSFSSAHPRGASIVTLLPELALKSGSVVAYTGAWATFYAAFPFLKVAQLMPGTSTWGTWALDQAYKLAGGEETTAQLKEKYQVGERRQKAEESVYRNVPFGSVGVRTAYDLEDDARRGKGGTAFKRNVD